MSPDTYPSVTYEVPFHARTLSITIHSRGLSPPHFTVSCQGEVGSGQSITEALSGISLPGVVVWVVGMTTRSIYSARCAIVQGAARVDDTSGWRHRRSDETILAVGDPRVDALSAVFDAEKFLSDARNTLDIDAFLASVQTFADRCKPALACLGVSPGTT